MEFIQEKDYDILESGTIYEFNLDLLTKSLILKISLQEYNHLKRSVVGEKKDITLKYYELRMSGVKELEYDSFGSVGPSIGTSFDDISILKVKDNEYDVLIYIDHGLKVICEKVELVYLFENEMNYYKAYRF